MRDVVIEMLTDQALSLLACTKCHGALADFSEGGRCRVCGTLIPVKDGVVVARELEAKSYFDRVFEVMRISNQEPGTWEIFYRQQVDLVSASLREGDVVIDVGCGPDILYRKGSAFVIGLDTSFESIRANNAVDMRLFASAASLPLRDRCADVILCFYSIHHMTGETVEENRSIVERVFREFARILKPGARLLVFEVSPRWPFGNIEELSWDTARRALGPGLDMFFWRRSNLAALGLQVLGGASLNVREFTGSRLTTFPPIFSKQWLRLPRILYPFQVSLYEWRMPASA